MAWRKLSIPAATLLLGVAIGYFSSGVISHSANQVSFVERREGAYDFINPLLECDIADDAFRNSEIPPFKRKIEDYLDHEMDKRWAASISVYYRELNDGSWFSIRDTDKFIPASLRKVPLMIALLKQAEQHREGNLLDLKVRYDLTRDYNATQNIKPSETMQIGREYSIGDLIFRMIVYSDNNAFTQLTKLVNPVELENVYRTLRMQNPEVPEDDEFLSVQTYSSFFRVLYNATYLNKESSDLALSLLSRSDFRSGLITGVPPSIPVAHKFGEHWNQGESMVQLHDCGIVYYPRHPYLLCVMSKGPTFDNLDNVIAEISRLTFMEVDQRQKAH